jgi:hypothetical protein
VNRILPLALAAPMTLLAMAAVFVPRLVTVSLSESIAASSAAALRPAPLDGILVGPPLVDETESLRDLYGNDIDAAVAEYSIDPLGSPYEMHSPQTELPRLASPQS